jgi:hypothetical protein
MSVVPPTRRPSRTCPRLESLEARGLLSLASPSFAEFRGQVTGTSADAIAIVVRREDFDLGVGRRVILSFT